MLETEPRPVLVIHENALVAADIADVLQQHGAARVVFAATPFKAVSLLQEAFCLVVMNPRFGESVNVHLLTAVAARTIPTVILLTRPADALASGPDRDAIRLDEPFEPGLLVTAVRTLLQG